MSTSGALFGNTGSRGQSKHLVEFKAGKMNLRGNMVIPDKRKGLVYVYQSDDHLMHLCWKDRQKGTVEDDLIIFPDDIEYKHVPQCTTGRVYLLKFKSNSKKMFFWMQESKPDKDSELWGKLNEYLSNPPTPSSSRSLIPAELAASLGSDGADIQNLLGNMDPQQMMRLITGMGNMTSLIGSRSTSSMSSSDSNPPSRLSSSTGVRAASESSPQTTATTTASATQPAVAATTTITTSAPEAASTVGQQPKDGEKSFTPIIQLRDLQDILSNFHDPENTERIEEIDLMRTITPDVLLPLLADPKIQERLIPFLPEGESVPKTLEELKENIESPQFKQTLRGFCNALLSGQLGPLIGQFNLGQEAVEAANRGDVVAFAKALQKHCKKDE